jgi:hypothetical protein
MDINGRNWQSNNALVDCAMELKRVKDKWYDADFEDRTKDAAFYKAKADHYQNLVDQGVEFEPLF